MVYIVYVLKDKSGKLYKGLTNNLERRLLEHRGGNTKSTAQMEEIEVAYFETRATLIDARRREKYLKSAAGRRFLKFKMNIRP
jgi:putative endonuclease